jgi:hypothetical protein
MCQVYLDTYSIVLAGIKVLKDSTVELSNLTTTLCKVAFDLYMRQAIANIHSTRIELVESAIHRFEQLDLIQARG